MGFFFFLGGGGGAGGAGGGGGGGSGGGGGGGGSVTERCVPDVTLVNAKSWRKLSFRKRHVHSCLKTDE